MNYQDLLRKCSNLEYSAIRKYGNIKRIFESRDNSTDDFWRSIRHLGHRNTDMLLYKISRLKRDFSEYKYYTLNPLREGTFDSLLPIRTISKKPYDGEEDCLKEGTEIKGFIFSSSKNFRTFGITYKMRVGGINDWFLTIGSTIIDETIKNSLIEVLERPHLYKRPGNWAVTHFVCPSPEFLRENYPEKYSDDVLERITPAPLKDESYRKQRKEILNQMEIAWEKEKNQ